MQFLDNVLQVFSTKDREFDQLLENIVDDFNYTFNLNGGFPSTNCALKIYTSQKPKTVVCDKLKQKLEEYFGNEFTVVPAIEKENTKYPYYYFVQLTVSNIQPFIDFSNANKDHSVEHVEPDFFDKAFPRFLPDEDGNPKCQEFLYHINIAIQGFINDNDHRNLIDLYNNNCMIEIIMLGRVSSKYMEALNRVFSRGDKIMIATKMVIPDDSKTQIKMTFSTLPQRAEPLMLTAGVPQRV
jgi:hypothetical protein